MNIYSLYEAIYIKSIKSYKIIYGAIINNKNK